jgi:hypothetical protein
MDKPSISGAYISLEGPNSETFLFPASNFNGNKMCTTFILFSIFKIIPIGKYIIDISL